MVALKGMHTHSQYIWEDIVKGSLRLDYKPECQIRHTAFLGHGVVLTEAWALRWLWCGLTGTTDQIEDLQIFSPVSTLLIFVLSCITVWDLVFFWGGGQGFAMWPMLHDVHPPSSAPLSAEITDTCHQAWLCKTHNTVLLSFVSYTSGTMWTHSRKYCGIQSQGLCLLLF